MDGMKEISKRIKSLRKTSDMTQAEVAQKLSISREAYQRIESGKRNCAVEELKELTRLFDVSADYLINGVRENGSIDDLLRLLPEWRRNSIREGFKLILRGIIHEK